MKKRNPKNTFWEHVNKKKGTICSLDWAGQLGWSGQGSQAVADHQKRIKGARVVRVSKSMARKSTGMSTASRHKVANRTRVLHFPISKVHPSDEQYIVCWKN